MTNGQTPHVANGHQRLHGQDRQTKGAEETFVHGKAAVYVTSQRDRDGTYCSDVPRSNTVYPGAQTHVGGVARDDATDTCSGITSGASVKESADRLVVNEDILWAQREEDAERSVVCTFRSKDKVTAVCVSKDGSHLYSAAHDAQMRMCSLQLRRQVCVCVCVLCMCVCCV